MRVCLVVVGMLVIVVAAATVLTLGVVVSDSGGGWSRWLVSHSSGGEWGYGSGLGGWGGLGARVTGACARS